MRAAELAQSLLANAEPERSLDVAERALTDGGFRVDRTTYAGALIAHRGRGGVLFSGHVDVVPPGEGWTRPPFGNAPDQDRLVGRGASDMRGPVACMFACAETTRAPMTVVLTSDEETTMATVRRMVVDGVVDGAPLVVVGEPTALDVAWCGKGVAWARLVVEGSQGHASTPRGPGGRAASAAEHLAELIARIPAQPVASSHPVLGGATAAVTGLDSSPGPFNVLPRWAEARIDMRFPPPLSPDDVAGALEKALGLPSERARLVVDKREPTFGGDGAFAGDRALAERVAASLTRAGVRSKAIGVTYASEANHWHTRAPTVICGPGSIARAHAPDEHITMDELASGVAAYRAIAEEAPRPSPASS